MRAVLPTLVLLLALAGCAGALGDPRPIVYIQDVQQGDVSCYLQVVDETGKERTLRASFEVCDGSLIGREARLSFERAEILAPSCQGDPACRETVPATLVVRVDPID